MNKNFNVFVRLVLSTGLILLLSLLLITKAISQNSEENNTRSEELLIIKDTLPPYPVWVRDHDGNINNLNKYEIKYYHELDKPDNILERSNLGEIYLNEEYSYNYKLELGYYIKCEDQGAAWKLMRLDSSKDAYAVITFSDCAGNDTTLYFEYYAPKIKMSDKKYDFGTVESGKATEKMLYLINYSENPESTYLKLKQKDESGIFKGFSILDETGISPNGSKQKIPGMDTLKFIVGFEGNRNGEYRDTIGFTCCCGYKTYWSCELKAVVTSPIIQVSDCSFPETYVNNFEYCSLTVKNIGSGDLGITDFNGPFTIGEISENHIFTIPGLALDVDLPIVVSPGEYINVELQFTPDDTLTYIDSIVFHSNSIVTDTLGNRIDNVCLINGKGKEIETAVRDNASDFHFYPSPADDKIMLSGLSENILSIMITDILGNEIYFNKLSISIYELLIDTKEFTDGMYFLKINSGKKLITRKFMVVH